MHKFLKHNYVRKSYTEELRNKGKQKAIQDITAITFTALSELEKLYQPSRITQTHKYTIEKILFDTKNNILINLNTNNIKLTISRYPFTRVLYLQIPTIIEKQEISTELKICAFNINGHLDTHLRPEHSYMQDIIINQKTDILILIESHISSQAPQLNNFKTIAHKKYNNNSKFPIGGYIKAHLQNIQHINISQEHDIIWIQIKHTDGLLTHIAACYTRTAIKKHEQLNHPTNTQNKHKNTKYSPKQNSRKFRIERIF